MFFVFIADLSWPRRAGHRLGRQVVAFFVIITITDPPWPRRAGRQRR